MRLLNFDWFAQGAVTAVKTFEESLLRGVKTKIYKKQPGADSAIVIVGDEGKAMLRALEKADFAGGVDIGRVKLPFDSSWEVPYMYDKVDDSMRARMLRTELYCAPLDKYKNIFLVADEKGEKVVLETLEQLALGKNSLERPGLGVESNASSSTSRQSPLIIPVSLNNSEHSRSGSASERVEYRESAPVFDLDFREAGQTFADALLGKEFDRVKRAYIFRHPEAPKLSLNIPSSLGEDLKESIKKKIKIMNDDGRRAVSGNFLSFFSRGKYEQQIMRQDAIEGMKNGIEKFSKKEKSIQDSSNFGDMTNNEQDIVFNVVEDKAVEQATHGDSPVETVSIGTFSSEDEPSDRLQGNLRSSLECICHAPENKRAIVFFHGFEGEKVDAQDAVIRKLKKNVKSRGRDMDVYLYWYRTGITNVHNLDIVADDFIGKLKRSNGGNGESIPYEGVSFLAHSMGGILTNKILKKMDERELKKVIFSMNAGSPLVGSELAKTAKEMGLTEAAEKFLPVDLCQVENLASHRYSRSERGEYWPIHFFVAGGQDGFIHKESSLLLKDKSISEGQRFAVPGAHISMLEAPRLVDLFMRGMKEAEGHWKAHSLQQTTPRNSPKKSASLSNLKASRQERVFTHTPASKSVPSFTSLTRP